MLGHDVKYLRATDNDLLDLAKNENRILLTKDQELFRRAKSRGLDALFVEGEDESERLACISAHYGLSLEIDISSSRCPKCNSPLKLTERDEVSSRVPEGSLKHYSNFWICTNCGKVYWQGRHWKKINETLLRAKELEQKRLISIHGLQSDSGV